MHVPDQLVSEVMALPPAARAELLALLQQSLPSDDAPGSAASDELLAMEWTEELDRRVAKLRGAESPGVDVEAAFAQIRKQLGPGRTQSGS